MRSKRTLTILAGLLGLSVLGPASPASAQTNGGGMSMGLSAGGGQMMAAPKELYDKTAREKVSDSGEGQIDFTPFALQGLARDTVRFWRGAGFSEQEARDLAQVTQENVLSIVPEELPEFLHPESTLDNFILGGGYQLHDHMKGRDGAAIGTTDFAGIQVLAETGKLDGVMAAAISREQIRHILKSLDREELIKALRTSKNALSRFVATHLPQFTKIYLEIRNHVRSFFESWRSPKDYGKNEYALQLEEGAHAAQPHDGSPFHSPEPQRPSAAEVAGFNQIGQHADALTHQAADHLADGRLSNRPGLDPIRSYESPIRRMEARPEMRRIEAPRRMERAPVRRAAMAY